MGNPKFSIIIPTYNRFNSLKECLTALYKQIENKPLFEVIVVNDDNFKCLPVDSLGFDSHFRLDFICIEHHGAAAARNRGIQAARGEIILFLDDDSMVVDGWVDAIIENWQEFPDSAGIGGYTAIALEDTFISKVNNDFFNWYLDKSRQGNYTDFINTCNSGYAKEILVGVGGFDEHFKGASGEDRDLNINIIKMGGKLRLAKNMQVYHDGELRLTGFIWRHFKYGKGAFRVYKKHSHLRHLTIDDYIDLYQSIIGKYGKFKEKILVFILLTVSQMATACGYVVALLFEK
jgi:cellulose synthase/poly-beta-1,6-N-acetylglucosamine synthase-like glycosyltransferase